LVVNGLVAQRAPRNRAVRKMLLGKGEKLRELSVGDDRTELRSPDRENVEIREVRRCFARQTVYLGSGPLKARPLLVEVGCRR
jgi:hypothetical protein